MHQATKDILNLKIDKNYVLKDPYVFKLSTKPVLASKKYEKTSSTRSSEEHEDE
jgi:hypothetical protein